MNCLHLILNFLEINFAIILAATTSSLKWSFPLGFPANILCVIRISPHVGNIPHRKNLGLMDSTPGFSFEIQV